MTIDAQANLRTLRDILRYAVTRFSESDLSYGHGQANAFEEAWNLGPWEHRRGVGNTDCTADGVWCSMSNTSWLVVGSAWLLAGYGIGRKGNRPGKTPPPSRLAALLGL